MSALPSKPQTKPRREAGAGPRTGKVRDAASTPRRAFAFARAGSAEGRPRRFERRAQSTSYILILPREREIVNTKIAVVFQITKTGKSVNVAAANGVNSRAGWGV